jgi:MFS family permease
VNNLNDGMAWGLFPLLYAAGSLSIAAIGALAAIYPAVWGLGQLLTGALSDRLGRKWLIAGGMWVQALGIGVIALASSFAPWAVGSILLGVGTAMVYPTLLPRSATWRTRPGEPPRSASTGCGGTPGTRWAPFSPACSPTCSEYRRRPGLSLD